MTTTDNPGDVGAHPIVVTVHRAQGNLALQDLADARIVVANGTATVEA